MDAVMEAVMHYGTPTIDLEAPVETVTRSGQAIRVTGYWDNSREGDYGHYVQVVGQKRKKNGEWYGRFQNLDVEIPHEVVALFQEFNAK